MMIFHSKCSVIVTTYNRPDALWAVLNALASQSCTGFEVIIADDGSTAATAQMVTQFKKVAPYPIKHVWQEDQGFRAAAIRNKAAAEAQYDYLVFLDGDCIPRPHFLKQHATLAEQGYFVSGSRLLIRRSLTRKALSRKLPLHEWTCSRWLLARLQRRCRNWTRILNLKSRPFSKASPKKWQGVQSCNLGIWKKDFTAIDGFNAAFVGWGYEDSDLALRLIQNGIYRKDARYGLCVLHLWHPKIDRSHLEKNREFFMMNTG